ncbi:hypothetical protein [Enterovibrio coralii]|uniref:hypothetical protein n=1 Tax=Enterovibrio coralii TaxID=294935 RepID=UPI000AF590F0|nr:hypothetical protein [Enterovibrio coralii]
MVDGKHHGSVQARLLRESLAGVMPAVVMNANRTMFGYEAAKKWGVDLSAYPNAVIADKPPSFWKAHRTAVNSSLAILAVCALIIAILTKHLRKQKQSERALAQSRALFKGVFDQSISTLRYWIITVV